VAGRGAHRVDRGDDPVSLGLKLHRSLVDTHRALLPGAEVPATLVQLNDRFMAQYSPGSKRLVSASPAPVTRLRRRRDRQRGRDHEVAEARGLVLPRVLPLAE
jgi:hypothetical protein